MIADFRKIANGLRRFLINKDLQHSWIYLFLGLILSFGIGLFMAHQSIKWGTYLNFILVISAYIQGFMAYLFMREKGEPGKVFYSLIFSLFAFFLARYLLYVHYYDWLVSGVVNKEENTYSLLLFYIKIADYSSIRDFFSFFKSQISFNDILILLLIISGSLEYMLFFGAGNNGGDSSQGNQVQGGRRIHRRFTGQKY